MKQTVGIDISKDGFHACLKEQSDDGRVKIKRSRSFSNDLKGFDGFLERSAKDTKGIPLKYVMEATGCYYEDLAYFLHDNGQEACVVLANKIKHYAKSLNVKTKTDKADAALIADFGLERSIPAWQPMSLQYKELRDLCRELSSIKKDMVRAKCQLHAMEHSHRKNTRVMTFKAKQIGFYAEATEEIEADIRERVEEDKELKEKTDKITKVKGLGLITVVTVLCETNGFRLFNNIRQAVSYAGLDVVLKESGKFKGKTKISKKGNAAIRQCLFMPALSAANHNKNMQTFYTRIVEKNPRAKRKGIVACMRKPVSLIFVLWKKDEEYDENYLWGKKPQELPTMTNFG